MKHFKLLLPVLLLCYFSNQSFACKCGDTLTVEQAIKAADVVLTGTILNKEVVNKNHELDTIRPPFYKYTVQVLECLKGELYTVKTITLYSELDKAACGYEFDKNKTYIIYAQFEKQIKSSNKEQQYNTGQCKRNQIFNEVESKSIKTLLHLR